MGIGDIFRHTNHSPDLKVGSVKCFDLYIIEFVLISKDLWNKQICWTILANLWPTLGTVCACKIQNGRQGAPKWPMGSGKVSTPSFGCSKQLSLKKFFDPSKEKEKTDENSGHYVINSS